MVDEQAGEVAADGGGGGGLNVWLGRAAMLGFVGALGVEIVSGKGVLESLGVPTPLPPLALALVGAAGAFTAFGIFRSASTD
eukprot:SM000023S07569  [mRNA]  locus=s23:159770:160183:- [translate_table: standard]